MHKSIRNRIEKKNEMKIKMGLKKMIEEKLFLLWFNSL